MMKRKHEVSPNLQCAAQAVIFYTIFQYGHFHYFKIRMLDIVKMSSEFHSSEVKRQPITQRENFKHFSCYTGERFFVRTLLSYLKHFCEML